MHAPLPTTTPRTYGSNLSYRVQICSTDPTSFFAGKACLGSSGLPRMLWIALHRLLFLLGFALASARCSLFGYLGFTSMVSCLCPQRKMRALDCRAHLSLISRVLLPWILPIALILRHHSEPAHCIPVFTLPSGSALLLQLPMFQLPVLTLPAEDRQVFPSNTLINELHK